MREVHSLFCIEGRFDIIYSGSMPGVSNQAIVCGIVEKYRNRIRML